MAEELTQSSIGLMHKRLSISREAELLQSFVGVHIDDDDSQPQSEEIKESKIEEPKSEKEIKDGDDGKKKPDESIPPTQELNEEIKKKGKRRKKHSGTRREELYCDKDRAAAVNMGSKDIKQSLKLKRKQDRSKALQIPEEAEPGTFLALGNYEMCRGDLQIAINFMSKVFLFQYLYIFFI